MVNSTPRPLYPRKKTRTHCVGGWVGPRVGLDGCGKFRPTGIRSPDRPDHSESLYRLPYPGPYIYKHFYLIVLSLYIQVKTSSSSSSSSSSLRSPSYGRSVASSKARSPEGSIKWFPFRFPISPHLFNVTQ